MSDFDKLEFYYKKKWIDEIKLKEFVKLNKITSEQYKQITGIDYVS